ncbi:MAG: type II and III secretion system protein, partial [Pseudomonadota bacterium]|nr:type II and III secretion system protein [Pseudomonadota bacterium]
AGAPAANALAALPDAAPAAASGPPVVLSWRAPSLVRVGQEFSVVVLARTGQPVGSLPLALHYDPNAFALVKVSEGDFLKQGGAQTSFNQNVDANAGRIAIDTSQTSGRGSGGTGTVTTVTLKAKVVVEKAEFSLLSASPTTPAGTALGLTSPAALSLRVVE